ncbi:uridine diphosphate-N-acetylglucosamine-binding protein YvcK [Rhodococcus sp. X156]|uniref:gluconeogenesis factor YvcK family protein n=1 Tax=Rhodococcus sp. X156 TaxID=2499145 RepID=UPI000FD9653C|nr:uridine diphosphate-N-acetylglucosamine-binding protein YvcK [Rhodococcus sp. X156]
MSTPAPTVVALGGGHGLHATLRAARHLGENVTAVVTVADDGGSSGRLRRELGALPPGDLRMALAALAADSEHGRLWSTAVQHRFGGHGALAGHPVGNLLITGLAEVLGDPVAALDTVGSLLGLQGRVLPMSRVPLEIEADVAGLQDDPRVSTAIRGQVAVATTAGQVRRVRLLPPKPTACSEAVAAVLAADLVVLGPGSWFSSVIPHVLVPELLAAMLNTRALRVAVLNLAPQPGETAGFSTERHLHVLSQHAPGLRLDAVVVDRRSVHPGKETEQVSRVAQRLGARLVVADVAKEDTETHDPALLGQVLADILAQGGSAEAEAAGTVAADRVTPGPSSPHPVTPDPIDGEDAPAWR